jgi:hypothetical protein
VIGADGDLSMALRPGLGYAFETDVPLTRQIRRERRNQSLFGNP